MAEEQREREPQSAEPLRTRIAWRRVVVLVLPLLYVAGTAVKTAEVSPRAWLAIAVGVVVGLLGSVIRPGEMPKSVRSRVWTSAALAMAIASAGLSERWAWVAFAREIALLGAGLAAVRALGAIDGDPGLAPRATEATAARGFGVAMLTRSAMAMVAFTWGLAALIDGLVWTGLADSLSDTGPLVASGGGAAALFAIGAGALLIAAARRLELSAPPRALACGAAAGVGLLVSLALAITTTLRADAAVALGFAIACPIVVRLARTTDALVLSRRGRRVLTLVIFGGPVATLAAVAGEGHLPGSGLGALLIALATLTIGAVASKLEEPLLPAKGLLLDALAEATQAAHDRDTRAAISKALARLREAAGHGAESPELWMLHPTRICTVDAAGYLQEREGELPTLLLDLARGEPGGMVRVDVLQALEVRRADLRPLLRWLEVRGALFATIIASAGR